MNKMILLFILLPNIILTQNLKCDLISAGQGNSFGLKFKSKIPCNFIEKVPQRSNVVKSYTTENFKNGKRVSLVIGVKKLETIPLKNEIQELFSEVNLKNMCSENSKYLSSRRLIVDGETASEVISKETRENIDGKTSSYSVMYFIIYKDKAIFITFKIFGKTESDAKKFFEEEFDTLKSIIGNFVITSKWEK